MLFFKFLGLFDLFAGVMIILTLGDIPFRLVIGHSLYLLFKAYLFRGDILSIVDGAIGVYGLFAVLFPIPFISVIAGMYLIGKGVYSLIM